MGMVLAELPHPAACRVAFAVVFVLPILTLNGFWGQRQDFREVGMDDDRGQQLVVIGNRAVVVLATQTVVAMDLGRTEVFNAVQSHQVTAFQEDIIL
jgi:hypothetical protein